MAKNLIDRKYYPIIWVSLIFASLLASVYAIYTSFANMQDATRGEIIVAVFRLLIEGGMSAVWCFVFAMIAYIVGARRYVSVVPRNDFIYTVMAFTAAARMLMGIIDAFCILFPRMYVITSSMLDLILLTFAYAIMFFAVFDRKFKFNPVERYNAFSTWAMVYFILIGLSTVALNAVYLIVFEDDALLKTVNDYLADFAGIVIVKDSWQTVASAVALSLYGVFVAVAVVIGEVMRKKAKDFRDPETRGEYFDANPNNPYTMRDDVAGTYGEFKDPYKSDLDENPYKSEGDDVHTKDNDDKDGKDGNVFDEFDI